MTEREKAASDITGIYYGHLQNYGDWNAGDTLSNWYTKSQIKLSRKEWDDLARQVKAHMQEREKQITFWTRQTIDEEMGN